MSKEFILKFISQEDFERHVRDTLLQYRDVLQSIDLKAFNSNIIDPIKFVFDKHSFNKSFDEIIALEIHRQRDKSNNNLIGYFHQNIFQYIKDCEVPKTGWDIIFKTRELTYYIELKNKHNTMNSSSSAKTFMRAQGHLLNSFDKDTSVCALVEVIAKESGDKPWVVTLDGIKQKENQRIRRISIDKFYEIVTGDRMAFRDLCFQLPRTIEKVIAQDKEFQVKRDTVLDELHALDNDILSALYRLAFSTYEGFDIKSK